MVKERPGKSFPYINENKERKSSEEHTTYKKTERKEAVDERKRREDHKWGVERVGGQANELRLSLRMRLDGLVLTWLGRVTSGGAVLSSSYIVGYHLRIISIQYCICSWARTELYRVERSGPLIGILIPLLCTE